MDRKEASRGLRAGVARADVTDYAAGPVNDPLFVKALVIADGATTVALVTLDAVALAEIGPIPGGFVADVRSRLEGALGIAPGHVLLAASHCHGKVRPDVADLTVATVEQAQRGMVPVRIGVGKGREDAIMENRRIRLRNGAEADVRHAYSLPPDEEGVEVGPVDPEIGALRLDREDGSTLALVYNFACHPIQGVPSGANTADIAGFASRAIETAMGGDGMALFLQGCCGDVNPVCYKAVDRPRDAEALGNRLGLAVAAVLNSIQCGADVRLTVVNESLDLPRADLSPFISRLEAEQARLLDALVGTSLNLKAFLKLTSAYGLAPDFPMGDAHHYLSERLAGRDDMEQLDARNRRDMAAYRANILTMEALTRVRANLALLRMHHAQNVAAGSDWLTVEIMGLRIGPFCLVSFPGELVVQIGLNIKAASSHPFTFLVSDANGYIYYAPTAEQLRNRGGAQEDSDCLLAPEWQQVFEERSADILQRL